MPYQFFLVRIFVAILFVGFFAFRLVQGESASVVITEIGAYEASGYEWVEVYNFGSEPVDLTGWKFWEDETNHGLTLKQGDAVLGPGVFAVIVQDEVKFLEQYPGVTATIFDSSWGSLNESGETIGLKDESGNMVEEFVYLGAENFSLERVDPSVVDFGEANWKEHESGNTVGVVNSVFVEGKKVENILPEAVFVVSTDTVFMGEEVLFDASASFDADGSIDAFVWNFGEGSIGDGRVATHTFFTTGTFEVTLTVQDTVGAVVSTSSEVLVSSREVDVVEEEEMVVSTTTPKIVINEFVPDPASGSEWIELFVSGTSSVGVGNLQLFDAQGLVATVSSSVGGNNFLVVELASNKLNNTGDSIFLKSETGEILDAVTYGASTKGYGWARIFGADDTDQESDFVETTFVTKGASNVIVAPVVDFTPSKKSSGGGGTRSSIPSVPDIVKTQKLFESGVVVINEIVSDPSSGKSEFVELFNTSNEEINLENWWIEDGSGIKTYISETIVSKGFLVIENPKGMLNNSGDMVVLFDGSGREIDRVIFGDWDDGEVLDNAPLPKKFQSLVRFPDGLDSNVDNKDFFVTDHITRATKNIFEKVELETENSPSSNVTTVEIQSVESQDPIVVQETVRISEILAAPASGDEEFVELYNLSDQSIDLSGLFLDDSEGGSIPYRFVSGSVLFPEEYRVFKKSETKIALNNGGDRVRLLDSKKNVLQEVVFEKAKDGESYSAFGDMWKWTLSVTPGEENILTRPPLVKSMSVDKKNSTSKKKVLNEVDLDMVRRLEVDEAVKTSGTVVVLPGIFGSQYFYIVSGTVGMQVYMNKKDFPELKVGDDIVVQGVVGVASGQKRIRVAEKSDITVLGFSDEPKAEEISLSQVDEDQEGRLVLVTGTVSEVRSTHAYIDDGGGELKVVLKPGAFIPKGTFGVGDHVQIQGILISQNGSVQLLPRGVEDVVVIESLVSSTVAFASTQKQEKLWWLWLCFGISAVGVGMWKWKNKKTPPKPPLALSEIEFPKE